MAPLSITSNVFSSLFFPEPSTSTGKKRKKGDDPRGEILKKKSKEEVFEFSDEPEDAADGQPKTKIRKKSKEDWSKVLIFLFHTV